MFLHHQEAVEEEGGRLCQPSWQPGGCLWPQVWLYIELFYQHTNLVYSGVGSTDSSRVSTGRGNLLRTLGTELAGPSISSQQSSVSTVPGGRGALLRQISGQVGATNPSLDSSASSVSTRQEILASIGRAKERGESGTPIPIGRAGLVSLGLVRLN